MKGFFPNLSPKMRLFLPGLFAVLIPVTIITIYSIYRGLVINESSIKSNMEFQLQTIKKMFEREYDLKLSKVKNDLKLVHNKFYLEDFFEGYDSIQIEVSDQINGQKHSTWINNWILDDEILYKSDGFVSAIHELVGGTTTIFQKIDSGYVRISTNVLTKDGKAAVGTFIPSSSEVIQSIEKGEKYFGRAYVVNGWYITAYEPLYLKNKLVGMLYAGDREKDLDVLRSKLAGLRIGKNGCLLVINEFNDIVINSGNQSNEYLKDDILELFQKSNQGSSILQTENAKNEILISYDYFENFKLKLIAVASLKEESKEIVAGLLRNGIIIALIIILIFSAFIYFITADNSRLFSENLLKSSKNMDVMKKALRESRHDFRTLFNSSSDDIIVTDFDGKIIEANHLLYDNFKLKREEILKLNIRDLLSAKSQESIHNNLQKALNFGKYTYESEYKTINDRIVYVEMKSRVIEYRGKQVLLTHVRDISERKDLEGKMISTIIQTEENERKRFSADLHDDLGPILSTIKLYTGLVKKNEQKNVSNNEIVKTIEELVDDAIQTTRNISRNIRPNILQDFGLAAAIQEFCDYIIKTKSININLNTQNYKVEKRGIEETILYHSAKELINNTLRYANASNIKLELKSFEDQIIMYYRDDGIGFDVGLMKKVPKGLGLNNIFNKIKSIKGTVDLQSEKGKGMFLIASVNLLQNDKHRNH